VSAEPTTLIVDGREIEVPKGTTVMEAARRLGIPIPTLCHVEGLEPASSCFLCCIQIEGHKGLSPACSMPVSEGMVVTTNSDDVHASRRMALELLLSDHAGECIAPCSAQCPAGLDIPGFLYPLAAGDPGESMEVLLDRLPMSGALGRVCPRLCEQHCRRGHHDDALAIGELHRWVADWNRTAPDSRSPKAGEDTSKSVAIVGAGPAGLTAALYLRQSGHRVTLYDAHEEPGGMFRYGIPAYRLPREPLNDEIDMVRRMGADFRMGKRWGVDFSLDDLLTSYDAVFLAIGAQLSQGLGCEGEEVARQGVDVLAAVSRGEKLDLGSRVVVVGGGNTAMDAARTSLRLGADVQVVYRRTRREMPCLLEEVEGAEEEGVEVEYLVAPKSLTRLESGEIEMLCQKMELGEPDSSGRRRPVPIAGAEQTYRCDTVIAAIGQRVELDLAREAGLEVTGWGVSVNPRTLETSRTGVFSGGDAVLGADLAVRAIGAGRLAAASIDQFLAGRSIVGLVEAVNVMMEPIDDRELADIFRGIEEHSQEAVTGLGMADRRTSFVEIDPGYDGETAREEARRCMSCGCTAAVGCDVRRFATEYGADPTRFLGARRRYDRDISHPEVVYEPGKCILCDACVRIAAEAGETLGVALIGRGFQVAMGVPFDRPLSEGLRKVAERCAEACPTGALDLRRFRSCDLAGCGGGGDGGGEQLVTLGGRRGPSGIGK
jgi:formate dehydrogenase major subunit